MTGSTWRDRCQDIADAQPFVGPDVSPNGGAGEKRCTGLRRRAAPIMPAARWQCRESGAGTEEGKTRKSGGLTAAGKESGGADRQKAGGNRNRPWLPDEFAVGVSFRFPGNLPASVFFIYFAPFIGAGLAYPCFAAVSAFGRSTISSRKPA